MMLWAEYEEIGSYYRYEWINPSPDKVIRKIECVISEPTKTDVYVKRIYVVQ